MDRFNVEVGPSGSISEKNLTYYILTRGTQSVMSCITEVLAKYPYANAEGTNQEIQICRYTQNILYITICYILVEYFASNFNQLWR